MNTDAGSRWTRRGVRLPSFLALVTIFVIPPIGTIPRALVLASCSFDPEKRIMTTEGSPVRLSVGSGSEILVDDKTCDDDDVDAPETAHTSNTSNVMINGTPAPDQVTIDQSGAGGAFPETLAFTLELGTDLDDTLNVDLTSRPDVVLGDGYVLHLGPARSGGVALGGVDGVDVDAGAGNDVVNAGAAEGIGAIRVNLPDISPLALQITVRGDGDDVILGGRADDRLFGQGGTDTLDGQDGKDVLIGGDGSDECVFTTGRAGCDPEINLRPSTAREGDQIEAVGSGWYPENGPISITFGSAPAVDVDPLEDGLFTRSLQVPAGGSTTEVIACQLCEDDPSNDAPPARFEYEAPPSNPTLTLDPERAAVGGSVSVSGSGWEPGEDVLIFVDAVTVGEEVARETAGDDSSFQTSFDVEDLPLGEHTLVACQRCGGERELRTERSFLVLEAPIIDSASNDDWMRWAGILVVLVAAAFLVRRLIRRWPPRVRTHLSDPGMQVSVTTVDDGSADQIVRLVPVHDPGVQDLEEVSSR